jgi:hypothetical protein
VSQKAILVLLHYRRKRATSNAGNIVTGEPETLPTGIGGAK